MTLELRNEPQQARAHSTLNSILDAARQVADERGWDVFTTADVAERAYVSIGTVYRYFPDRVAILDALDPERHIADEVRAERFRQNEKWGQQNHPDGTGPGSIAAWDDMRTVSFGSASIGGAAVADIAKSNTNDAAREAKVTWAHILLEEVAEAFAESDPARLRAELVQVQAVAQQWVAAIDRRSR